MSKRLWIAAACLYAAMALFTFGHCASHGQAPECILVQGNACTYRTTDTRGLGAVFAALGWPFYWSWELQS